MRLWKNVIAKCIVWRNHDGLTDGDASKHTLYTTRTQNKMFENYNNTTPYGDRYRFCRRHAIPINFFLYILYYDKNFKIK